MRHLGVNHRTAWMLHNKIMQAMSELEDAYVFQGKVQVDHAYFGGQHCSGKPDRGSEYKVPILALASVDAAGHTHYVKMAIVAQFSSAEIADCVQDSLEIGCDVIPDGLALLRSFTEIRCVHQPVTVRGSYPNELPEIRCINTALRHLKSNFSVTIHAIRFDK
jgi:hypothetical protein